MTNTEPSDEFLDYVATNFDALEHAEQLAVVVGLLLTITGDNESVAKEGFAKMLQKIKETQY